ncbi:Pentatricopeptide repeat-containing protein [Thalictrum thalictroides]|uniref:Pentatricopeptide repeat-containing protein n=1 Tax=Thalictrum thalictroides TaxID=46969 RepID=A0A7J6WQK2_THATH|nr:Pentatricopeptide repeat-containing protein [Thalictrum thalictroides]
MYGTTNVDLIMSTHLINLYGEFGMVGFARNVFDEIPLRDLDVIAFSSMMGCYNKAGEYYDALNMLRFLMEIDCLSPNEFVLTSALSASAGSFSLCVGRQTHAYIVKALLCSDVFVGTALINMYTKCNEGGCAKKAFLEIEKPNVVAWNAVLAGEYNGEEVLMLFEKMWRELESGVSPDHVTFATVLRACKDIDLFTVSQLHGLIMKIIGVQVDVFIGGALFNILVENGSVFDAKKVFDGIHGKDITSFNLAIRGFRRNGHREEAVKLFHEAIQVEMELNEDTLTSLLIKIGDLNEGKQLHSLATKLGFTGSREYDAPIASSLLMMYADFQCLDDAIRLFNQIICPDLILCTSMISCFSLRGETEKALKFYAIMLSQGLAEPPNHYTFSTVLHSCANLAAVEEGRQIHAQIIKSDAITKSDVYVSSALIDMYAKSGYVTEAKSIFNKMPERDLPAWNAMITGLAQHGHADTAIEVFQELLNLPNIEPNHITFLGILSACSHSGLVVEGHGYFNMIKEPTVNHYACFVDLLSRSGCLEEAVNLIEEMPFDPNEVIWSSLLSASAMYNNIDIGEYSAKKLLQLNPKDPGTYVTLSNIYAAAGRWQDVNRIRKLMNDRVVRKNPGHSWLNVKGKTHVFLAADNQHVHKAK